MLYLLHRSNVSGLAYRGGQQPILHLEADLRSTVQWADQHNKRWAFTLSNAGAFYFEDRAHLDALQDIDWDAVTTNRWSGFGIDPSMKDRKQAEFLVEGFFPWHLVRRIAVHNPETYKIAIDILQRFEHVPLVEIKPAWHY